MTKILNFDMDGTIVDFYSVEGWLEHLEKSSVFPYLTAKPLINLSQFAKVVNKLQKMGYIINIISWCSKNGTEEFNGRIEKAKKMWLKKHLKSVNWDNIYIVPYGTPKHSLAEGTLFDDEERNRTNWNGTAYTEAEMLNVLKNLTLS